MHSTAPVTDLSPSTYGKISQHDGPQRNHMTHRVVAFTGRYPVGIFATEVLLATDHDTADEDGVQLALLVDVSRIGAGLCENGNHSKLGV